MRVYSARGPSPNHQILHDGPLSFEQEYITKMIDVFKQAEDLENAENLHALCSLMQTICAFTCRP